MLLEQLRETVCRTNRELKNACLMKYKWRRGGGSVSGFDRKASLVVIRPNDVPYEELTPQMMVVTDLEGNVVEGDLTPSTDILTHVELYKAFPEIGGIAQSYSMLATAWAQAGKSIPAFGITQAEYFFGEIPCTRRMTQQEIERDYEKNKGLVLAEQMRHKVIGEMNAVLLNQHGPFTWGKSPEDAFKNAEHLEDIALLAWLTRSINPDTFVIPYALMDKRFNSRRRDGVSDVQTKI